MCNLSFNTGSHLDKGISAENKKNRLYQKESTCRVDFWVEAGFILIFDENFVHGGGIVKHQIQDCLVRLVHISQQLNQETTSGIVRSVKWGVRCAVI